MRAKLRVTHAAFLFVLLCAVLPVAATAGGPPVPRLDWAPCGPEHPRAECAVVRVPLDYDRPHGPSIELALVRVPAGDQQNRIGSVFLNPGGPGGSGVDFVLSAGEQISAALQGRFDVVGFDPRGVARSTPIRCFASNEELAAFFAGAPVFPYQNEQDRPFFELFTAYSEQCLSGRQAITAHMSTADVARDLDVLRQAVGDEKLTYLGFSYGSFLGTTYANLFPHRIRAMVLDGVIDPRVWSGGVWAFEDREAAEAEFEEFLRLCDEAGTECALGGPEGAKARFAALEEAIRAQPLVMPDGQPFSYDDLVQIAFLSLYSPELWGGPSGYGALLGALADAVLGDLTAARTAHEVRQQLGPSAATPGLAPYANGFDAQHGTICSDTAFPGTFRTFAAMGHLVQRGSRFGPLLWWMATPCARWPVARDRYVGPWTAHTSAPVLLVSNLFDGVTDYAGGVATSKLLPNSRLLTYAGWGHTALGRSQCVLAHVAQYAIDGTLPPPGTVCPANPNPFLTQGALRAAGPVAIPLIGLPPPALTRHH